MRDSIERTCTATSLGRFFGPIPDPSRTPDFAQETGNLENPSILMRDAEDDTAARATHAKKQRLGESRDPSLLPINGLTRFTQYGAY